jgi:hypothetical protein
MDLLRNVPKEDKNQILDAVEKIDKARFDLRLPRTEVEYLFDIWNTYVQPSSPQKMSCNSCVNYVFSNFKFQTKGWKRQEKIS